MLSMLPPNLADRRSDVMPAIDHAKLALGIAGLLALPVISAQAGNANLHGDRYGDGWSPSVGRNAPQAIVEGLAETHAGWAEAMADFYADPRIPNEEYFDYYRQPYGRWDRRRRWR